MTVNDDIRKRVSEIDARIIALINERCLICVEELRKNGNRSNLFMARDEIMDSTLSGYDGPLPESTIRRIFTEIFFSTAKMAMPLSVAFLGPEASFSGIAASLIFGGDLDRQPRKTISDVFFAVEKDEAVYGVVPIENSTEGAVTSTLDELMDTTLNITARRR